jgi:hypothetical protein
VHGRNRRPGEDARHNRRRLRANSGRPRRERRRPPRSIRRRRQWSGNPEKGHIVRRQNEGKPTAAQQAEHKAGTPDRLGDADNELQHARALDREGKEAECMNRVRHAKELLGKR